VATLSDERLNVVTSISAGGLGAQAQLHVRGADSTAAPGAKGGGFDAEQWRCLFIGEEIVAGCRVHHVG
jgi:hypothetical protein